MKKNKFSAEQNRTLTECYRRLNQFHNKNLNENLLLLSMPNKVKDLKNIFTCFDGREQKRCLNWYKLTNEGKELFTKVLNDNSDGALGFNQAINENIFLGKSYINFNPYV